MTSKYITLDNLKVYHKLLLSTINNSGVDPTNAKFQITNGIL